MCAGDGGRSHTHTHTHTQKMFMEEENRGICESESKKRHRCHKEDERKKEEDGGGHSRQEKIIELLQCAMLRILNTHHQRATKGKAPCYVVERDMAFSTGHPRTYYLRLQYLLSIVKMNIIQVSALWAIIDIRQPQHDSWRICVPLLLLLFTRLSISRARASFFFFLSFFLTHQSRPSTDTITIYIRDDTNCLC